MWLLSPGLNHPYSAAQVTYLLLFVEAGFETQVEPFPLYAANDVLQRLKGSRVKGSGALIVREN